MKTVVCYQSLDELPPVYLPLFESKKDDANFFSTYQWYQNFFTQVISKQHDIYLLGVQNSRAEKAFALLPMCVRRGLHPLKRFQVLKAATNYYASLFDLLINDDEQSDEHSIDEDIDLLVRFITGQRGLWSQVDLRPMSEEAGHIERFCKAFRSHGWRTKQYFCFGNWYLNVAGRSFVEYAEHLSSRMKNTLRKRTKHLNQQSGFRIELFHDAVQLQRGISAYEQVYRTSWKKSEAYPQFIRGLMRSAAEEGKLRLGVVFIDDLPIAAQLWIVHHRTALIYKLAYDQSFSYLSPGTVLTAYLIEHVIESDHVREIDYLSGDDTYKRDWMSHRRERWGLMAFNAHTVAGRMAIARHITLPTLWTEMSRYFRHLIDGWISKKDAL